MNTTKILFKNWDKENGTRWEAETERRKGKQGKEKWKG